MSAYVLDRFLLAPDGTPLPGAKPRGEQLAVPPPRSDVLLVPWWQKPTFLAYCIVREVLSSWRRYPR